MKMKIVFACWQVPSCRASTIFLICIQLFTFKSQYDPRVIPEWNFIGTFIWINKQIKEGFIHRRIQIRKNHSFEFLILQKEYFLIFVGNVSYEIEMKYTNEHSLYNPNFFDDIIYI